MVLLVVFNLRLAFLVGENYYGAGVYVIFMDERKQWI